MPFAVRIVYCADASSRGAAYSVVPCAPPSSRRPGPGIQASTARAVITKFSRKECPPQYLSFALLVREERSLPGVVEQRRELLTIDEMSGAAYLGGLLFGYIFLAAQEKVTSCRAAPDDKQG